MVETVYTPNAPVSKFPISQATKAGCLYFLSGQTGIDPVSGQLAGDTIEQQSEQAMRNIGAILESQGLDFTDVAHVTCYMSDMRDTPGSTLSSSGILSAGPPAPVLTFKNFHISACASWKSSRPRRKHRSNEAQVSTRALL